MRILFRQRDMSSIGSFAVGSETLDHVGEGVHAATQHVVVEVRERLGRWLEEVGPESTPSPILPAADDDDDDDDKEEPKTPAPPAVVASPKTEAPGEQAPKAPAPPKK